MDPINKEREIEQWLDAALYEYGMFEARPGLESRLRTRLQAERDREVTRYRWWWTLGAATAAVIVIVVWLMGMGNRRVPTVANGVSTPPRNEIEAPKPSVPQSRPPRPVDMARRTPRRVNAQMLTAEAPRREQFPSPAPLNDQEQMLARYVREFPEKAALMARAQTDLHKQDEREMASPWPENDKNGSEPQQ